MEVVTCLHGFSQRGSSWAELAGLVGDSYRWLTPDLTAAGLDEAVSEVLDLWAHEGVERSHLVGYSQGGRVALYLACTQPDRLLTLTVIGAHAGLLEPERSARLQDDLALAAGIESEGVDWFAEQWAARPLFRGLSRRGAAFLSRLDADRRSNDAGRLAAVLRGLGPGATPPFWERLPAIRVPTLILVGAEDARYIEFAGKLARAIPDSHTAVIPEAGHPAHLEQPELTASLLTDHLSSR
jgi:2-succinyl-6-hydroxy-2,4-cyclohexadiene-1-carboxylate synthase